MAIVCALVKVPAAELKTGGATAVGVPVVTFTAVHWAEALPAAS